MSLIRLEVAAIARLAIWLLFARIYEILDFLTGFRVAGGGGMYRGND